jgi:hypothetical protein
LRDYIYIPLGGNKVGRYQNYSNLFAVFLIGGLWHGASWMFVIWGALHGIAIVIHRIWKDLGLRMWGWMGWFITFNFVNVAWVFFRAKDFASVEKVLGGMIGINGAMLPGSLAGKLAFLSTFGISFGDWLHMGMTGTKDILILIGIFLFTIVMKNSQEFGEIIKSTFKFQLLIAILLAFSLLSLSKVSEFLYFQF